MIQNPTSWSTPSIVSWYPILSYFEPRKFFKISYLAQFSKFLSEFWHVISNYTYQQVINSNMGSNMVPLILASHWSKNKEGYCLAPTCKNKIETTKHILIECDAYIHCKIRLYSLWISYPCPIVHGLVLEALSAETDYLLQFIIDCSVLPSVIRASQSFGESILQKLFYLTRTWCWSVHKQRMKLLGRWNYN